MPDSYLLFDIDGTLMQADGAGRAALERAYAEATGLAGALAGVVFQGRTDSWIIGEVVRRTGVDVGHDDGFLPRYYEILEEELAARSPSATPGTAALLDRLAARADVALGLGTGNLRRAAFIKLRHVGLDRFFERGGFGDRHEDRTELLREAADAVGWTAGERLVVIGDTEHDISAAHAIGAVAVGVATGFRTLDELQAAGADALLEDLTEGERALEVLLGA